MNRTTGFASRITRGEARAFLLKGPQEFDYADIAGYLLETASAVTNAPDDRLRFRRWRDSVAQGVGEAAHAVSHHTK